MDENQTLSPAAEEPSPAPAEEPASSPAAEAKSASTPEEPAPPASERPVMIHVRFSADGSVIEISERPASLPPQAWFDRLTDKAGTSFQPLSGGRGVFRLPRAEVDALKTPTAN